MYWTTHPRRPRDGSRLDIFISGADCVFRHCVHLRCSTVIGFTTYPLFFSHCRAGRWEGRQYFCGFYVTVSTSTWRRIPSRPVLLVTIVLFFVSCSSPSRLSGSASALPRYVRHCVKFGFISFVVSTLHSKVVLRTMELCSSCQHDVYLQDAPINSGCISSQWRSSTGATGKAVGAVLGIRPTLLDA